MWTAGFDELAPYSELDGARLVSGRLRGMRRRRRIAGAGVAGAFLAVAIGVTASARLTRNEVDVGSDGRPVSTVAEPRVKPAPTTIAPAVVPPAATADSPPAEGTPKPSAGPPNAPVAAAPDDATRGAASTPSPAIGPPVVELLAPSAPEVRASAFDVDVVFDDSGLHGSPDTIPMGTHAVAFHDHRTDRSVPVTLRIASESRDVADGQTLTVRSGPGLLGYFAARVPDGLALDVGWVRVTGVSLPEATENVDVFTIAVADGAFTLPNRTEAVGAPSMDPAPANRDRWTIVHTPVRMEFVFKNPQKSRITTRIAELPDSTRTTTDGSDRFKVTLDLRDDHRYTLVVKIDDAPEQRMILWLQ